MRLGARQLVALEVHKAEVHVRHVVALGDAQRLLEERLTVVPAAHLRGGRDPERQ